MPNYLAKGVERMRELGRQGGLKSGETRRANAFTLRMAAFYVVWDMTGKHFSPVHILEAMRPEDRSSGDHDTDWRCPACHHFNSIKSRACAKCKAVAPANGRLTRKALRERAADHRTMAILRKRGL
jgi:uncharacterized paraquat-inducible protein A